MVAVMFFVFGCAFYAFRLNQFRQHNAALNEIRAVGAVPMITLSNFAPVSMNEGDAVLRPTFTAVLLGRPVQCVRVIRLNDSAITADVIRNMKPSLDKIIPCRHDNPVNPHVTLDLRGNPNLTSDFIRELASSSDNLNVIR